MDHLLSRAARVWNVHRAIRVAMVLSVVLILAGSCKDMGNELPPPPPPPFTADRTVFSLVPGRIETTILSGGTQPYSFISQGNLSVAVPSISRDTLNIRAIGIGTSSIVVGDNSSPRLADTISVSVTELSVGQSSFTILAGDTVSTTISGGTLPYVVVSVSDPTKASATVVDSILMIVAHNAGSAVILVGDAFSPQRTDTVSVIILPRVSFSSDIQPIFTTSCVNSGCHPGGGAPFPLQAGQSYTRLVGVPATNGQGSCAGDKRVEPFNANASVLVKRLEGSCGLGQMPLGSSPLSSAQIQLIRDWIIQGANNN